MKRVLLSLLLAAMAFSPAAQSQDQQANPAVTHLMKSYGLEEAEAKRRIDLQGDIIALSDRLNTENDPAYADMYIKHTPKYQVMVMFAGTKSGRDNKAFVDSLDPRIRPFVKVKTVKSPRSVTGKRYEQLNAILSRLEIPYTAEFDLAKQRFVVKVEDPTDIERVRAALPRPLRADTVVEVGVLPETQAAPTGVQAGDRLYGGNPIYTIAGNTSGYCTLGYAVNYTSGGVAKKGILTAGHCPDTMYVDFGSHFVTLSGPMVNKPERAADGISDKYDYQIWDVTGLTVDNQIVYKDLNSIPEFAASGVFRMTAITTFLNQKAGMIVCKSGHTTGITCGEITNGNLTRDGAAGWIQVSKTQQTVISLGGDSGGPWFLYPGTSSTITGVGIHTAGDSVNGPTGIAVYMPIDYIDDHITSVNTIKQ
jgi:V8-like Glu-specific endopeptidase